MKRIMFLAAVMPVVILAACSKGEVVDPATPSEEVSFSVSLALPKSGSMTRGTADELYAQFYQEFVETKLVVPQDYKLQFSRDGKVVGEFSGQWDADIITLPEGEYTVTGVSTGEFEKLSLSFSETVNISRSTSKIELTASYDCFMLIFDRENISYASLKYYRGVTHTGRAFNSTESMWYIFLNGTEGKYDMIEYRVKDTANKGSVSTSEYNFEKGKYYYFDMTKSGFVIPPMDPGSVI